MAETVNHPSHYNSVGAKCENCGHPIECITVVEAFSFNLGNAVKYIWRAPFKGKFVEDLAKAIWYLTRAIAQFEATEKRDG